MYAIIVWIYDDFVSPVLNNNGSMKLFETLKEADEYANTLSNSDDARVISIEGIK